MSNVVLIPLDLLQGCQDGVLAAQVVLDLDLGATLAARHDV